MAAKPEIDGGTAFDWGKTSPDDAVYRPGYPASFYSVLQAVGLGRPGHHILDGGTGTGVFSVTIFGHLTAPMPWYSLPPCPHPPWAVAGTALRQADFSPAVPGPVLSLRPGGDHAS